MNARASAVSRPTIFLAALAALALSFLYLVRPVAADTPHNVPLHEPHQGADSTDFKEDEDCGDATSGVVWHFILNQYDAGDTGHLVAEFDSAGVLEADASKVLANTQHFYITTPTDDILLDANAEVDVHDEDANLVLSHVCHTGEEQSSTPTPSEEQSVSEEQSQSASQTPEGSVEEGTGTPSASVPDGAMAFGGSNPLPTIAFGLILLASLAGLAFANVKAARSRS